MTSVEGAKYVTFLSPQLLFELSWTEMTQQLFFFFLQAQGKNEITVKKASKASATMAFCAILRVMCVTASKKRINKASSSTPFNQN